jgi:hypothetical protein
VIRRNFWDRAWVDGPWDFLAAATDHFVSLGAELFWLGSALAGVGIIVGRNRRWPVHLPLLVMVANFVAVALHGSRSDIFVWHRYYIPSYLMMALLAAMGCQWLLEQLPGRARFLPLTLPVLMLLAGYRHYDRSRYRLAEDFSRALLETLPPGSHLIASDDNILFVLMYLHFVEGERPDINLILRGVGGSGPPPLRFDPEKEPLFLTHHPNWRIAQLEVVPVGLTFRAVRSGRPTPLPNVPKTKLLGEDDSRVPKDHLTRNLIGHFHYMLGVTFEQRDWPRAWNEFQAAAASAVGDNVLFYNLGLIYERNGLFDEAHFSFKRSYEIDPRAISGKHVRAGEKMAQSRRELERLESLERMLCEDSRVRSLKVGSPEYHLGMAALLKERGERLAAHGHFLRASLKSFDSR